MLSSLLFVISLATPARADADGTAWLERIDATARVDQATLNLEVSSTPAAGGPPTIRGLDIWQLGDDHRLVRLTSPPRLAGTGLLVTEDETLHLFLPAYPPARRVVGSKRQSAFAGTDFAMEDLARLTYADDYDAVVVGKEGDLTRLDLTPRPAEGQASVTLWVGDDAVVRRAEHTDKKGRLSRRLEMEDVRPVDGVLLAHTLRVEDLSSGRRTVATLESVDLSTRLGPELFTVTNLERP